jgi:hypothetical protein
VNPKPPKDVVEKAQWHSHRSSRTYFLNKVTEDIDGTQITVVMRSSGGYKSTPRLHAPQILELSNSDGMLF